MEDNKNKIDDETLEMVSGGDDDDYLYYVDYNSPCPCGGNHDWNEEFQHFPVGIFRYFECKKCGKRTKSEMCG